MWTSSSEGKQKNINQIKLFISTTAAICKYNTENYINVLSLRCKPSNRLIKLLYQITKAKYFLSQVKWLIKFINGKLISHSRLLIFNTKTYATD